MMMPQSDMKRKSNGYAFVVYAVCKRNMRYVAFKPYKAQGPST